MEIDPALIWLFTNAACNGCSMSQICNGENLWQWSWLEIRLNTFCQSPILQGKQKQLVKSDVNSVVDMLNAGVPIEPSQNNKSHHNQ